MTQQRCCSIFLAFFSLLLSACSGDGTRHPAAQMGDLGGTAGAGSPAPSVGGAGTPTTTADADSGEAAAGGTAETVGDTCSATPDCDDGQPCNGVETCVDEACQAGEAASCGIGMECSNDDAGACVFTDQSPWIIYEADDDTPGVPEVYAVKRGLLGQMEPIKINAPFAEGWEASRPGEWSPDHQWYSFTIIRREPYDEAAQVVYFGRGLPMPAVELKGAQVVQWSPSGRFFATTEAHGLAIYQYKAPDSVELVHREAAPERAQFYGDWALNDTFIFAAQDTATELWDISALSSGLDTWQSQLLSFGHGWVSFAVSPSKTEIIYDTAASPSQGTRFFAQSLLRSQTTLLANPGRNWLIWSPRGGYLLLLPADSGIPNEMQMYLGAGDAADGNLRSIQPAVLSAGFNPDGTRLLLRKSESDWSNRLSTYDIASGVESGLSRRVGHSDETRWSPDGGWVATPTRETETSDIDLELIGVIPTRDNLRLDSIPSTLRYYNFQFNKQSKFFAYYKGDGATRDYDAAYVDLRYHLVTDPKPVRLPGEGSMWIMNFDPDGSALYYIRERADGARDCYYLDLSLQVAKEPVKVNRSGRATRCFAQPLGD